MDMRARHPAFKYRVLTPLLMLLMVSGCAVDPVPELRYYRLGPVASPPALTKPVLKTPLVVETFTSSGVYGNQAILYASKPGGSLRSYHYQLWVDSPVKLLQARLIKRLRDRALAPLVTDRLAASQEALRIQGKIEQFERVKLDDIWQARVTLELRAERHRNATPILLRTFSTTVNANDETLMASTQAFADAVEQIFAEFNSALETELQR